MTALLAIGGKFLGFAWPYLLGAAALLGIYGYGHHQGYEAEHEVRMKEHAEATRRTSEIILDQQRIAQESELKAQEKHNALLRSFADHEAAAKLVPHRGDPALSGAAVRVLNSAVDTANAALYAPGISQKAPPAAAPAAEPADAGSDQGSVLDWAIECTKQYAEVAAQVLGLQDYVDKLKKSTEGKR